MIRSLVTLFDLRRRCLLPLPLVSVECSHALHHCVQSPVEVVHLMFAQLWIGCCCVEQTPPFLLLKYAERLHIVVALLSRRNSPIALVALKDVSDVDIFFFFF